ncbi:MAG: OmpA family protein [Treponema sp.]|nr:OmpA family protein [Treponema sp.]
MRKIKCVLLALFLFCSQIYAESDSPKFFPRITDLKLTDAYIEGAGGVAFPLTFTSKDFLPMTSYGGLFASGIGYNFGGWLVGLEYNRSMWGEGVASGALMNHFENNLFSFRVRRLITHVSVKKLPPWLNLAPGLSFGVDCITTNYYPSLRAKEEGRSIDIKFGQENARCFFGKVSFEADFYCGTDLCIPFISSDWNTFYDTSIGGGFASFFTVSIGVRCYPFGLFHKNMIKEAQKEEVAVVEPPVTIFEEIDNFEDELVEEPNLVFEPDTESAAGNVMYRAPEEIKEPVNATIQASIKENFTPDSDGVNDTVDFELFVENISETPDSWQVEIFDQKNFCIKIFTGNGEVPYKVTWDGSTDNGEEIYSMNLYTAVLTVVPCEADRNRFNQQQVTAKDDVKSGILMTVIIPDKKWKIIVNTIHFDPDKATFVKISEAQRKENYETLDSLADQLNEHLDCSVIIEGYANNVTNTEREDREELIPLSKDRADSVRNLLIQRNIPQEMLSTKGLGGSKPIAEWQDKKNWWKNRRVEFIVEKIE